MPDGHTARFTPTPQYNGPAGFTYSVTDTGDGAAASFAEVWNDARFVAARGLFGERGADPGARELPCFECPVLLEWEAYRAHLADGGAREAYRPRFGQNERYNYFWNRRPAAAAARRRGRVPAAG